MRSFGFTHLTVLLLILVGIAAILPAQTHVAFADDPDDEAQNEKEEWKKRKERYTNWMRDYSKGTTIRVKMAGEDEESEAELVPSPIFRYSTTAIADDATLWAWTRDGRPVAVQKVEVFNYGRKKMWTICFAAASEGLVSAHWPVGRRYAALQPGIKYRPIPDAEAPGDSAKLRTGQMKTLKGRFTGRISPYSVNGKQFTDVKAITTPLYQYVDPDSKLPFGAIYSMIDDKGDLNPGLLLILEARPDDQGKSRWEYAGVRLGMGQMLLRLDNVEVWRTDAVTNPDDQIHDNWTFYFIPREFD